MHAQTRPEPAALEPGLLSAADVIAWRCRQANAPLPRLPSAAILTHQPRLRGKRRPWSRDALSGLLSFDTRLIPRGRASVALAVCRGVGAPATAVAIEELAALGVSRLLAIDVAGSIDPALHSGDVVLIESAVAGDGTSPHYMPELLIRADTALTDALAGALTTAGLPHVRGACWSTDAVYREARDEVRKAREDGAGLVDMETASMLAVATSLGVAAAAALVVADELTDGWKPPRDSSLLQARLEGLLAAALAALTP